MDNGTRALHYVQEEIRHLSAIELTPEGKHALLVFKIMLWAVWGKAYCNGTFVFKDRINGN